MTSDKERTTSLDKKTLVFGASLNPMRVSHQAVQRLDAKGLPVVAIGGRFGNINDVTIHKDYQDWKDIHTITLYMGSKRQAEHIDYFLSLEPRRIIFNPGAENHEFYIKAKEEGIEVLNACTLVMLATGQY